MKLITSVSEFEDEFLRLMNQYNNYSWAVAWAGSNFKAFSNLISNQKKIRQLVIGVHFYQTHPDFIKQFSKDKRVRFIKQPSGTFHPKVYLFENHQGDWELIVGSSNFTTKAFSKNTEANLLISCKDSNSIALRRDALFLIKKAWSTGGYYKDADLEKYILRWKNSKTSLESMLDSPIPDYEIDLKNWDWEKYLAEIRTEDPFEFKRRLMAIDLAKSFFQEEKEYGKMTEAQRGFIAGIPIRKDIYFVGSDTSECFGNMGPNGIFKSKIKDKDKNISKAIDSIPLNGEVTKQQYDKFLSLYKKAFLGTRLEDANNLGTASRLLSMKRPDIFICLNKENRSKIQKAFKVSISQIDYKSYWDEIILPIQKCVWWRISVPKNEIERRISSAKVAFLDSIYYY